MKRLKKLEDVLIEDVQTFAKFKDVNDNLFKYINNKNFKKNIALDYCLYRKQKENLSNAKFKEILDATLKTYLAEDSDDFETNVDRPVKLLLEDSYFNLETHVQTNLTGILEKVPTGNFREILQGLKPAKGNQYKAMAKAHKEFVEISAINSEQDETRRDALKAEYAKAVYLLSFGPQKELGLFGKAQEPVVPKENCLNHIYRMMADGIYADFAEKFKDKAKAGEYMNEVIKDLKPEQKAHVYTSLAQVYVGVTAQEKAAKKK